MTDSKKMIPLSELTLLDRFLFDAVMENDDIHKTILQIILGRDIALLTKNQTEKELRTSPFYVRFEWTYMLWMKKKSSIIPKCRNS